jgi:hypothetical protein
MGSAVSLRKPVDSSSWESVLEEGQRLEKGFMERPDKRQMIYSQWLAVKQLLLILAANNPKRKDVVNGLQETFQRYNITVLYPIEESLLHRPLLD